MATGFGLDPNQGLSPADELRVVKLAAELGYASAWTTSGPDAAAFDRCLRWYQATGLPTGISAVPASGQPPEFYAEQASRLWKATRGTFTLVVGSGTMNHAAKGMRAYLPQVRHGMPDGAPVDLAALGPLMLDVAAELSDGASLNWCTAEQVAASRARMTQAAKAAGRAVPPIIEYIRTAVDPEAAAARRTVASSAAGYLRLPAYHQHFVRMGVADDLQRMIDTNFTGSLEGVNRFGAAGRPGETRQHFEHLAHGLDLPIVRVLLTKRGDVESARRVLEECRPRPEA